MKRVKHIDITNPEIIDRATRNVLANHKKRRRLWQRLGQGNKTVRQNIQDHADKWSHATGKHISYEAAKRQLFHTIRQTQEREQLKEIIAHDEDKTTEQNIAQYNKWIKLRIENRDWKPDAYREFWINDGIRQKRRKIAATSIVSQTFHWTLILSITPVIMHGMVPHTCASIPGRGAHYGKRFILRWMQDEKNTKYCAKIDISKFYQSISQTAAKTEFRRYIADKTALWLIDTIIESYPEGLPIGTYTSQWFANWILQRLDHYIKEVLRVPYAMRYMDDIVMFAANKKELHRIIDAIEEYLQPFGLHLKGNWQVFRTDHTITETGIIIDKIKRTEDITKQLREADERLKHARIPHKIIYRQKYKDTKARKKTHTGQEWYKQIYIQIPPEYMAKENERKIIDFTAEKLQRLPEVRRAECGTIERHAGRDVDFMGFRFYREYTTIRRKNCLRIRRKYAKAAKMREPDTHTAQGCLSYLGQTKHTDSHKFTVKYIDNVMPVGKLKGVVRNEAKDSRKAGGYPDRGERTAGICGNGSNYKCAAG